MGTKYKIQKNTKENNTSAPKVEDHSVLTTSTGKWQILPPMPDTFYFIEVAPSVSFQYTILRLYIELRQEL